ncbi:MAG: flagellar biosynthesis regulatory protein FlaF [Deltaproteobacteria bacterium]|nr:flagellar biosynthesis regulatory protein FlaF [Deltaproteobacteria bacterium]TLN04794.1 MAG: flagellar biosynthesis regulator FlaF [bacterium]
MSKNPFNIYQNANKEGMSQRELEASLLTRAGLMLKGCQDNWDAPDRDLRLEAAIKFNQKIWSLFQSELSMPDNPLPKNIREDILNLSLFLDKRLFEVLAYPEAHKLTIAININLNLAAGLLKSNQNAQDIQQAV